MNINPDNSALVEGIISLSKAFNREVIAKGVETTSHGIVLIPIGYDCVQRSVVAKAALPHWLKQYKFDPPWRLSRKSTANYYACQSGDNQCFND